VLGCARTDQTTVSQSAEPGNIAWLLSFRPRCDPRHPDAPGARLPAVSASHSPALRGGLSPQRVSPQRVVLAAGGPRRAFAPGVRLQPVRSFCVAFASTERGTVPAAGGPRSGWSFAARVLAAARLSRVPLLIATSSRYSGAHGDSLRRPQLQGAARCPTLLRGRAHVCRRRRVALRQIPRSSCD
jgi:hypothetical protein